MVWINYQISNIVMILSKVKNTTAFYEHTVFDVKKNNADCRGDETKISSNIIKYTWGHFKSEQYCTVSPAWKIEIS